MGSLSHTVGGTSNLVNFKSAARVPIESLKCHFLPVQEGSGDPSPSNVRPISGWTGATVYKTGKNIGHIYGYSASTITSPSSSRALNNGKWGTTINTVTYNLPDTSLIITQSAYSETINLNHYANGYFIVGVDNLTLGELYDVSFKISNITNNPLNVELTNICIAPMSGSLVGPYKVENNILYFRNIQFRQNSVNLNQRFFEIRVCGMSFTLSEFMVTPANTNDGVFEPYSGTTIPVTFPVLGKNKFDYANADIVNSKRRDDNGTVVADASGSYCRLAIPVIPNTEYTISGYMENNVSKRIYFLDKNQDFISRSNAFGGSSHTFTTLENCYYIQIQNREVANAGWNTVQLELGSTATTYEPYSSNNTVYGGYVDLAEGEVVAEWIKTKITSALFYGTWDGTSGGFWYETCSGIGALGKKSGSGVGLCESLKPVANLSTTFTTNGIAIYDSNIIRWIDLNHMTDSSSDYNDYLKSNPLYIAYQIATPIHYPLTPTTLRTLLGANNVWSNTNSNTEVSYAIHDSPMIMARKKSLMDANNHRQGELVFWLDGNDVPVNNKWIDKIGGIDFTLPSAVTYDSENKLYNFCANGIGKHSSLDDIEFGHHWRIEYDLYMKYDTTQSGTFIDFGSITSANKALGIGLSTTGNISVNWKLNGNNSNPMTSSSDKTHPNWPPPVTNDYYHCVGYHEMYAYNDDYDRLYVKLNGKVKGYNTLFPKAYYGPQWQSTEKIISIGGGVYQGKGNGYLTDCKIHSIKIFVYD